MAANDLTAARLREVLSYDPETGLFHWLVRLSNRAPPAGSLAGGLDRRGYIRIKIDSRAYFGHRLAFLWMTGAFPSDEVDHRNGVPACNIWSNLRPATRQSNMENQRRARADNRNLWLGVSQLRSGRFQAVMKARGRRYSLGSYATPEEAHRVYVEAKRLLHPGCTI